MAAWVVISGSPRGNGTCAQVSASIVDTLNHVDAKTSASLITISSLEVHGCIGCDACKDSFTCIYEDDQHFIERALDEADAALVISPIYFAGAPSQFKAVLDRFQPCFWKRKQLLEHVDAIPPKKPLYIVLVGEGGDPYGADHALAQIASPFALANYGVSWHDSFIRMNAGEIAGQVGELMLRENERLSS